MNTQQPFLADINLADARLGAVATFVTDDWFAEVNRMLQPHEPEWREGVYDECGKWMDGWESRRKRHEGYDYAIVRLGKPGLLTGVDIDTRYFTGNHPPSASLEGCFCPGAEPDQSTNWHTLLEAIPLEGDSHHYHCLNSSQPISHIRLNIFPDGGVARLRVYGRPYIDWQSEQQREIDLAAALNGGRAIACNDQHFGHMSNLLNPGRGINMGDGWETARRRTPGNDWVIIALGHPGVIERVSIDTCHFKGNFPDSASIQAAFVHGGSESQIPCQSLYWQELLPPQKLSMDCEQSFAEQLNKLGPVSHIKLNIFPDGGISRLRLFGKVSFATPGGDI